MLNKELATSIYKQSFKISFDEGLSILVVKNNKLIRIQKGKKDIFIQDVELFEPNPDDIGIIKTIKLEPTEEKQHCEIDQYKIGEIIDVKLI